MKEVQEAVGRVETKTDDISGVQTAMADRENARSELEATKEDYAAFGPVRDRKISAARASRGKAAKFLALGVVAIIAGVLMLTKEIQFGGQTAGIGALFFVVGILWVKGASGTISKWVQEDTLYREKIASLTARSRRKIEI